VKQLDENANLKKLDDRKKIKTRNLHIVTIQKDGKDLALLGNPLLLDQTLLGIFSSMKCPARLILAAHDYAKELSSLGKTVIGGFQSPVEKEMLEVLIRGKSAIVICPARSLIGMRIPAKWLKKIEASQLLILSSFPNYIKRPTKETILKRNQFIVHLSSELIIVHAEPGGKVEMAIREAESTGKKIHKL
jgi:predicted Rossmann fold nucleotide-binding protein DprA/Smf involved in DNA uptake